MKSHYKDSLGNEISRSLYESHLAQDIIQHPIHWLDIFNKLNSKIIAVLIHNRDNVEFMNKIWEYLGPKKTDPHGLIAMLSGTGERKPDYTNQFGFDFYKPFFETILPLALKLPEHMTEDEKEESNSDKTYKDISLDRAFASLRPPKLFSEGVETPEGKFINYRGRIELPASDSLSTPHAGLLSEYAAPPNLRDRFTTPAYRAKDFFKRDPSSPTVQHMEQHGLPFIAGPSGSLGFSLAGIDALIGREINESKEPKAEYRKIFMGIIANLVFCGHHSFPDAGVLLNELKAEPSTFGVDPTMKVKEYYDQFLTESYRLSDSYFELYTQQHPSKYYAMTWTILRDAVTEMRAEPNLEATKYFTTELYEIIMHSRKKDGELDPADLKDFVYLLKDYAPMLKSLRNAEPTAEKLVLAKLIKKMEESGIQIDRPETGLSWGRLRSHLQDLTTNPSAYPEVASVKNLINFLDENKNKAGIINDKDLTQLVSQLNIITQDFPAPQDAKEIKPENIRLIMLTETLEHPTIALQNKDEKDAHGYSPLMHAIDAGNTSLAKYYLESKASPEQSSHLNYTPLHIAAMKGNLDIVHHLLEFDAKIEKESTYGYTPLDLAVMYGHGEIAKQLIKAGAFTTSLTKSDASGKTPLMVAAENGNMTSIETLVACGMDISKRDAKNEMNFTPAALAAKNGHIDVLQELFNKKVNVNSVTIKNSSLAHFAAYTNQAKVINFLAEHKSDMNIRDEFGFTPLHSAVIQNGIEATKALIEAKANLNTKSLEEKTTPLTFAINQGNVTLAKLLIEAKADTSLLYAADENGTTHAMIAAHEGEARILKTLAQCNIDLNRADKNGWTPLHQAAFVGKADIISILLTDYDLNAEKKENKGYTPLQIAVMHGQIPAAAKLLDMRADSEVKTAEGYNILQLAVMNHQHPIADALIAAKYEKEALHDLAMKAAEQGSADIISKLAAYEIDLNIGDISGFSPATQAARHGKITVLYELAKHGVNLNKLDETGGTPAYRAAEENRADVIKALVECKECKVNLDLRTANSWTAAHAAADKGSIDVLKALLSNKADLNITTRKGETLEHLAVASNQTAVLDFLIECKGYQVHFSQKNSDDISPISLAAHNKQWDLVAKMLRHLVNEPKIDFTQPISEFKTPLTLAIERNHWDLAVLMLKAMPKEDLKKLKPIDHALLRDNRDKLTEAFIKWGKEMESMGKKEECHQNISRVYHSENVLGVVLNTTGSNPVSQLFKTVTKKIALILKSFPDFDPKKEAKVAQEFKRKT